jgi:hypothetical protein
MMTARFYRTTDIELAAYLHVKKHHIVQIEDEGRKRCLVFEDSDELQEDVLAWANDNEEMLPVRAYPTALKHMKSLVMRGESGDVAPKRYGGKYKASREILCGRRDRIGVRPN